MNEITEIDERVRPLMLVEDTETGCTKADRATVLKLLCEALTKEIVCVLRYKRQESIAKKSHSDSLAAEFHQHAQDEQVHVDLIAERITQLGGVPNFTPVGGLMESYSEFIEAHSLQEMIKENWVAERMTIDSYREIIRAVGVKDPTTHRSQ